MEQKKKDTNDQELMRSMKVSKAVAAMAIPSVISSLLSQWFTTWQIPFS